MRRVTLLAFIFVFPAWLHASGTLQAWGMLPSDTVDARGDTIGGIGSGIVYDKKNDRFFCISDRGPGDGTMQYRPRFVLLKVSSDPSHAQRLLVEVKKTVILKDEAGREMTGANPVAEAKDHPMAPSGQASIDPEAIAIAPDGSIYISEEYGPFLYQFDPSGNMLRRIRVPENFLPINAKGKVDYSAHAALVSGRQVNCGFEGMTILPDGKIAVLLLQDPLVQDGGRRARFTRVLFIDLSTEKPLAEYVYPFETSETLPKYEKPGFSSKEKAKIGVTEITALDANRFLVLERDGTGEDGSLHPAPARYKSVWIMDIRGATNLLDPAFAAYCLPATKKGSKSLAGSANIKPVAKQFLFNLPSLQFPFGKAGPVAEHLGAKWEGIAFLGSPEKGVYDLILTNDNDFLTPKIHDKGVTLDFPRAQKPQDTFFLKIRASLSSKGDKDQ